MKRTSLILLLSLAIFSTSDAKSTENKSKLFLVGGGLKTCTSMASKNCNTNSLANNEELKLVKISAHYQINKKTLALVKSSWPKSFAQDKLAQIINALSQIIESEKKQLLSKSQLNSLLKKYDNKGIISKLNDAEYYLLLDLIEQPVMSRDNTSRLKEHVDLINSTNSFSTEIYHDFINLAKRIRGKDSANILVITASARDPFEAADFYQSVFTQAGGNTQWLPLDATLNSLLQQQGDREKICETLSETRLKMQGSINREYVYPDLTKLQYQACLTPQTIYQAITKADGIFINGGDQSLTKKAFINADGSDGKALQLIKEKLANNSLIIGGTSAGTAVMSGGTFNNEPIVMITNGQSSTALVRGAKKDVLPQEGCQKSNSCTQDVLNDDLTYNSTGGLGLFNWGIMDTHFSERGRQGRLAKLVLDTNTRFAFGVDEATALIVSNINSEQPKFEVIGQSGVFIVENNKNTDNKKSVITHYISRDDRGSLENNRLTFNFAPWKSKVKENADLPKEISNIFEGERYLQTTELLCRTINESVHAQSQWKDKTVMIEITKQTNSLDRFGILTENGSAKGYCSYQNYLLSF